MRVFYHKELYSKEALLKAAYHFTDRAYVYLGVESDAYFVDFTPKEGIAFDRECLENTFKNELLAQVVHQTISRQTAPFRNGDRYVGTFTGDRMCDGTYTFATGQTLKRHFEKGIPSGEMTYTVNSVSYKATWSNGTCFRSDTCLPGCSDPAADLRYAGPASDPSACGFCAASLFCSRVQRDRHTPFHGRDHRENGLRHRTYHEKRLTLRANAQRASLSFLDVRSSIPDFFIPVSSPVFSVLPVPPGMQSKQPERRQQTATTPSAGI